MWAMCTQRFAHGVGKASPLVVGMTGYLWWQQQHGVESGCEQANNTSSSKNADQQARLRRKQTTLQHASAHGSFAEDAFPRTTKRFDTKKELDEIRANEKEMLLRWERDEDGWRELPARAWPAYQPNPEQLKDLQTQAVQHQCNIYQKESSNKSSSTSSARAVDLCTQLLFHIATSLVFYQVDPEAGLRQYESLAKQGHVDSMVACGIVLVEGMGVPPNEQRGIEWLQKAVSLNSAQACYELGTLLYTGIDGVLEEDPQAAFELFRRAAEQDHTAGLYMMADCLVEGEGTEQSVGRAVPLFYRAAERGHRYSRQKIRELLAKSQ